MDLSSLRKFLAMIVAIAAMVLLAPLAASAHEGHGHRQASLSMAHAGHVSPAGLGQIASAQLPAAEQFASALADVASFSVGGACMSGCCFSMGCCGATLLVEAPRLDPPAGLPLLVPDRAMARASASTYALLEPPNALA